ncbi:MAG: hypothetical protein PHD58_05110 [Anaerolineales bacterium]|nr:hypothetical protein [Anaerolineales bacterium]
MKKATLIALVFLAFSVTAFAPPRTLAGESSSLAASAPGSGERAPSSVDNSAKPTPAPNKLSLQATPGKPPRPTATPLKIPPPADPKMTNLLMGFGVLAVAVVIVGVWLNWGRIFKG